MEKTNIMIDRFVVYEWNSRNKKFLKKLLEYLERMYAETWIERKHGILTSGPWKGKPLEDEIGRASCRERV